MTPPWLGRREGIALSFAGEQRLQVEQVAECLKAAGVRVFYDAYEKADLWGKDLYQHLTDVYQKKARFCIVFASENYAKKAWTSLELKSAQSRAFTEKGSDYVLPVRFDATEIPGILPTVGYLSFQEEGVNGICAAALEKLGMAPPAPRGLQPSVLSCDLSPRALLLSEELSIQAFPTIEESGWGDEIELSVAAATSEIDSLFSRFRNHSKVVVIAYGFDVALARVASAVRVASGGKALWKLKFLPERTDFCNDMEVGTSSMTADQFAERRVRRLLLNERPTAFSSLREDMLAIANESMEENLVRGLNSLVKIEQSNFPALYVDFGADPRKFLEIAWISAVANLKLSAAIKDITYLRLVLDESFLNVEFSGRRHRKYVNVDPYEINVSGGISLKSSDDKSA